MRHGKLGYNLNHLSITVYEYTTIIILKNCRSTFYFKDIDKRWKILNCESSAVTLQR